MLFITVVYIIVCVFLVIAVILQRGDSGLGSVGGNSNTILGTARGTVMSKITYILATAFFLGALALSVLSSGDRSLVDDLKTEAVGTTATTPDGTSTNEVKPQAPAEEPKK